MSKITIGKKEYEVTECLLDQCELLLYEENSRVYSAVRADGSVPTQKVRACVLPEEITDGDIFTLLGQYHLVGRKDWSVFEQAAYVYRQKEATGIAIDILAKNVGLTESKVSTYLKVYTFMLEHDDLRPDRWSYYEEYLKNRGINKYRDTYSQMDDMFVTQVKTEKIKQAMDVRTVLGEVAKAKDKTAAKIMQDIIEGKTSIYDGHERFKATGKASGGYQRIKKFHDLIADDDFQKALLLEAASNKSVTFELKKIQKSVNKLLSDIEK